MNVRLGRLRHIMPLWAVVTLVGMVFLYGTTPDRVGPVGVTVFFAVGYLFVALTIQVLALLTIRFLGIGSTKSWRFRYALIAAFLPITAVGLDSLDQLVLRDLLIFFGLVGLLIFYVSRQSRGQR